MNEVLFIQTMIDRLNHLFNPLGVGEAEEDRVINVPCLQFPDNPKLYEFTHPIGNILVKSGSTTAKTGTLGVGQRSTAYQSKLYLLATEQYGPLGIYGMTTSILNEMDGRHIGTGKPFFKIVDEAVFIDNGASGFWERVITFVVPGVRIP